MNAGAFVKTLVAYVLSVAATYVLSVGFYTQQVIAKMAAVGAEYTAQQQIDTFLKNLTGLWILGAMTAIALLIGFVAAFLVKHFLKPLAPIAYPAAGAAAMLVMLVLIEQQLGGGAGIVGGARDATGLALQALAGLIGGAVFAFMRPR
ncbi:hypothetical protein [Hyphococcus sp.]|jgi:predicted Co/Zn/Cd cation transporter (cation efflux family)|uniref:hypothetical protein n=1 Tax=Hyphococcus sp. TaxID=2038636 RepID=UPI003D0E8C01